MTTLRLTDDGDGPLRDARGSSNLLSAETTRWIAGMGLAALVSYFSTTYGLQARIDVLESRLRASESTSSAVVDLTREVAILNQKVAVLTAIMERVEARQGSESSSSGRGSRMFDH
jgi:hypothetical protein